MSNRITIQFNGVSHHIRKNQLTHKNICYIFDQPLESKLYLRDQEGNIEFLQYDYEIDKATSNSIYNLYEHAESIPIMPRENDLVLHLNCLSDDKGLSLPKWNDLSGNGHHVTLSG